MNHAMPLASSLRWGAAWGIWTCGLVVLVAEACRKEWLPRAIGLSGLSWDPELDPVLRLAAWLHMPAAVLPVALIVAGIAVGCAGMLAITALDGKRLALASFRWSFLSWRSGVAALFLLTVTCVVLYMSLNRYGSPVWLQIEWIAMTFLPLLLAWLALHPAVVSARRAGPLSPRPTASPRTALTWLSLAACVLLVQEIPWAGFFLAIPLRALEVHWLMNREHALPPAQITRRVLRSRVMGPWFALNLWPFIAASLLLGPVVASSFFLRFEAPMLIDAARSQGVELPLLLRAWISCADYAAGHWWIVLGLMLSAALGWWLFAEGRLAHLQQRDVAPTDPRASYPNDTRHASAGMALNSASQEPA